MSAWLLLVSLLTGSVYTIMTQRSRELKPSSCRTVYMIKTPIIHSIKQGIQSLRDPSIIYSYSGVKLSVSNEQEFRI
ncbi:hypothetical protein QBC42DRAFT_95511 [Cladorrhinum samala]|uniref:Uncharacterized protein n=1 Tax=Cladorrhinum samala TaxID=585594 RepID=A0AAV9HP40_9PEZI|nr:hypothetical protein QBC42DRAFT_95511 [Cladorrhinum samala]